MFMLFAAVAVLLAGALLPLAFDDGDEDDVTEDEDALPTEAVGSGGNLLDDEPDPEPDEPASGTPAPEEPDPEEPDPEEPDSGAPVPLDPTSPTPEPEPPSDEDILTEDVPQVEPGVESGQDNQTAGEADTAPDPNQDDVTEETREGRQFITGTDGADDITVPVRAFVQGGAGADVFTLDGATPIGDQAEIADFDPKEDSLVILWDDAEGGTPPEISLGRIEGAADQSQIRVDGVVVAHVTNPGSLTAEDIRLIPSSTVQDP